MQRCAGARVPALLSTITRIRGYIFFDPEKYGCDQMKNKIMKYSAVDAGQSSDGLRRLYDVDVCGLIIRVGLNVSGVLSSNHCGEKQTISEDINSRAGKYQNGYLYVGEKMSYKTDGDEVMSDFENERKRKVEALRREM